MSTGDSVSKHRGSRDIGIVSVTRVITYPGKRPELIRLLPDSHEARSIPGREAVVWAVDPDNDDQLLVFEYWSDLIEYAAGLHSEYGARFMHQAEGLIAEHSFNILEGVPVWAMGVPAPAGPPARYLEGESERE